MPSRSVDLTKVLTRREITTVLAELQRKGVRSRKNTVLNLVLFRLAVCCGLRASEIASLGVADVGQFNSPDPISGFAVGGQADVRVTCRSVGRGYAGRPDRAGRRNGYATGPSRPLVSLVSGIAGEATVFSRHTLRKKFGPLARCWGRTG